MPFSQKVVFSRMEVTAIQRLDWDQYWDFHPRDSHPIGVEDLVLGLKDCENSHTLTTTTTTKTVKTLTHSQQQPQGPTLTKSQQSDRQSESMLCASQRSLLYHWSWMKSSARHTLSNKIS